MRVVVPCKGEDRCISDQNVGRVTANKTLGVTMSGSGHSTWSQYCQLEETTASESLCFSYETSSV